MAGRPSKYDSHIKPFFKEIKEAYERGTAERDIAKSLGVAYSAWREYKNKFPAFMALLKRDEEKTREILEKLDSALIKIAIGFNYEEKKQYITEDENGKQKKHTEITKKYYAPNATAIYGALNRFDQNYKKDKAYYDLKKQELELKKLIAENNNFDLNTEQI